MDLVTSYLPGDPRLIDQIVYELKSQGIFDQFRKECIADVDTKPAYQNLSQRVEGSVVNFLKKQKFSDDLNKNQLREQLRKSISESGFFETGVERIVDQVVNPKITTVFLPKVEDVVYRFLGLEKPDKEIKPEPKANVEDLLPNDLEAVSPESEHGKDNDDLSVSLEDKKEECLETNSLNSSNTKTEEDESPPFEPLEENTKFSLHEENSVDSHISGISGMNSHNSEIKNADRMEVSQDTSQNSINSEGNLSIITSEEDPKMETSQEIKEQINDNENDTDQNMSVDEKQEDSMSVNGADVETKNSDDKNDDEAKVSKDDSSTKRDHDKPKSFKSEKEKKNEKEKTHRSKSESKSKDSKDYKSKSKEKSKESKDNKSDHTSEKDKQVKKDYDKDKNRDRRSKDGKDRGEKDKSEKSRDKSRSEKDRSREKSDKDKEGRSKSSRDKEKTDKDKSDKDRKDRSSSSKYSSSKDRDKSSSRKESKERSSSSSKQKEKESSKSSSRDKSKSSSSEKDKRDSKYKDKSHKSSSSYKKDKDKKSVDDHYSLKDKRNDRRSTDRDSNDGSGKTSRNGSFTESYSQSNQEGGKGSSEGCTSGSGDSSNSDNVEEKCMEDKASDGCDHTNIQTVQCEVPPPVIKYIKPKFASNIHEAMKLMKIRKQLAKLERQNKLALAHVTAVSQQIKLNADNLESDKLQEAAIEKSQEKTPTDENLPVLKGLDLSMENFEALEARLAQEMSNISTNTYGEEDDKYECSYVSTSPVKKSQRDSEIKPFEKVEIKHVTADDELQEETRERDEFRGFASIDLDTSKVIELNKKINELTPSTGQKRKLGKENVLEREENVAKRARIKNFSTDTPKNGKKLFIKISKFDNLGDLNKARDKSEQDDSGPCYYFDVSNCPSKRHLKILNAHIDKLKRAIEEQTLKIQNNIPNVATIRKDRKRKLLENQNNNSLKSDFKARPISGTYLQDKPLCNSGLTLIVDEPDSGHRFSLPLSPSDSDKSGEHRREETITVKTKRTGRGTSSKRYSSEDLYKPRPILSCSTSRRRAIQSICNKP